VNALPMSRWNGTPQLIKREGLWDPAGVEFPKHPDWVSVARLAAAGVAYRAGFSLEGIEQVKVIVAEALSHCLHEGREGDRLKLSFAIDDDVLVISVSDPAFRPALARSHIRNGENELFIDGLFLIRCLAHHLEYAFSPESGLTLRIRKSIA
jgi:anti-sigma regulatory factor (Ser/Thr protein kinase)